jgi:hypothetical protein
MGVASVADKEIAANVLSRFRAGTYGSCASRRTEDYLLISQSVILRVSTEKTSRYPFQQRFAG